MEIGCKIRKVLLANKIPTPLGGGETAYCELHRRSGRCGVRLGFSASGSVFWGALERARDSRVADTPPRGNPSTSGQSSPSAGEGPREGRGRGGGGGGVSGPGGGVSGRGRAGGLRAGTPGRRETVVCVEGRGSGAWQGPRGRGRPRLGCGERREDWGVAKGRGSGGSEWAARRVRSPLRAHKRRHPA